MIQYIYMSSTDTWDEWWSEDHGDSQPVEIESDDLDIPDYAKKWNNTN